MTTTLHIVNAGARGAADDIVSELMDCRESLPKGANHRPPYPVDDYARYAHIQLVNRDNGKSPVPKGLEHLMAITFDNIQRKMSLSEAKRWIHRADRIADAFAAELHIATATPVRPVPHAFRREERATSDFNLDQMRVLEARRDVATIRAAIKSCRAQIAASQDTLVSLEQELAVLVTATPTTSTHERTLVHA